MIIPTCPLSRKAPIVFRRGKIVTLDPAAPAARTLEVCGERIGRLGKGDELGGPDGWRIDLRGSAVLPGFIDTHVHLVWTGMALQSPQLVDAECIDDILDSVATGARGAPSDQWVCGNGYDAFALRECRPPTREELDRVAPDRAVLVRARGGHSCVVSSVGLLRLSLAADTPGIVRGADGEPTGELRDEANLQALAHMGAELSAARRIEAIRVACDAAAAKGITTVHALEGAGPGDEAEIDFLLSEGSGLAVHVVPYPITTDVAWATQKGLRRIGGCLLLDGAIEARTAALFEPYADSPAERGRLYYSDAEIGEFVAHAHEAGMQAAVHAIAERAIEQFLDAVERVVGRSPDRDHRHRIEHFVLPARGQMERAAELGVALSIQPTFAALWGGPLGAWAGRLGPERAARALPIRSCVEAGLLVAGGSDSFVSPIDPLLGIHSAVHHPVADERVTVERAVAMFTRSAAAIAFEEHTRGTIRPDMQADLTILSESPFDVPPARIRDIEVLATMVAGEFRYVSPTWEGIAPQAG